MGLHVAAGVNGHGFILLCMLQDFKQPFGARPVFGRRCLVPDAGAAKVAIRALGFECVGQGQAAHDVAAAHLQASFGAEGDFHQHFSSSV